MRFQQILGGVLAIGALALLPGTAVADETDRTVAQIKDAVAAEGATPVVSNPDVSIPATGAGVVALGDSDTGEVIIDLPAHGAADTAGRTTVFDGDAPGTEIAVQPTENGVRALVHIDSARAPERYPFTMRGDVVRLERASRADHPHRSH